MMLLHYQEESETLDNFFLHLLPPLYLIKPAVRRSDFKEVQIYKSCFGKHALNSKWI